MERIAMASTPSQSSQVPDPQSKPVLRLIPLDDTVVFPSMGITLTIDVGDDERVVLVPRHENEFLEVGTIAEVSEQLRLPGGAHAVALSGEHRALIGAAQTGPEGELRVEVDERPDDVPVDKRTRELEREYRAVVEEILELRGDDGRIAAFLRAIVEPGPLADSAGYSPNLTYEQKVELLRTLGVTDRLELAVKLQRDSLAELQVRKRIREDVQEGADKQQREYFLRKQMESIRKELGEDEGSIVEEYRAKIEAAEMPETVQEQALKELGRLERMGEQTGESSMIRTYLDWLIAVPWNKRSEEHLDPVAAREVLDADHEGLDDVKDRITEYLAVRKLRQDRGIEADPKSGAILTLIGPPGTGKTSIGESIARATGREFVRMSLGGVRDEAEIRGHRRTYIGSMPGKVIQSMRKAKRTNPLFLLDEVDKIGMDFRGDPSSALLEVLDPEQNSTFNDHYLEVDYDLSNVMFVTTANTLNIPPPLMDRMEIIRIAGYTEDEKIEIARRHLLPKILGEHGLNAKEWVVGDSAITELIRRYTREAGVRNLEREISNLARKAVKEILTHKSKMIVVNGENVAEFLGPPKFRYGEIEADDQVGLVTGLAWTEVGGELLTIEGVMMPGKGRMTVTGNLKDVMKESISAAASYVRSRAVDFGIEPPLFDKRDIHVHVPEGATPKDGPSAGVGMATVIVSMLTGIPVRRDVAMTGEITLRGRVLPIGGLKEKLLAALRGGIKTVLIPEDNVKDLAEIPNSVKNGLEIVPVSRMDEVLAHALVRRPIPISWEEDVTTPAPSGPPEEDGQGLIAH